MGRILLVLPSFPEASEAFMVRQARGLGANVCPLSFNDHFPVPDGVHVVRLEAPAYRLDNRTRWQKALLLGNFIRYGSHEKMPKAVERAFRAILERLQPPLVLAQYGPTGLLVMNACRDYHIPLFVHFHGFDLSSLYRHRLCRASYRRLLRAAAGLIVVNDLQRRRLLTLGARDEDIRIIPCGVPVKEFSPSDLVSRQPCRFLAVGRLTAKKAPELTIRAFARCAAVVDEVRLTIIGAGPLRESCQRLAAALGVADGVHFAGARDNHYVRREMAAAGVFLQHSRTAANGDEEGWPVAIAEALASGLPVIATRHAGIVNQVQDGESGYLIAEGEWKTMAKRMVTLAQDPEKRRSFGRRGRKWMEKHGDAAQKITELSNFLMLKG